MPAPSEVQDSRTLVDRTLDRVKNNRLAAALIAAALALGGVAALSDTLRRLGDAVPPARAALDGVWRTTGPVDISGAGPTTLELTLRDAPASRVTGTVRLLDSAGAPVLRVLDVEQGRRDGNAVHFAVSSGWRRYPASGGPSVAIPERIDAEVAGGELRGVYERDGSAPLVFTARRTGPAPPEAPGP